MTSTEAHRIVKTIRMVLKLVVMLALALLMGLSAFG
jgi:hypothetical protein